MIAALLLNGVVIGSLYALVAIGFTLIYNATETVNFAHGESLMLGAYFLLTTFKAWSLPYPLAVALTLAAAAVVGLVLFHGVASRPLMEASLFARVIALMGLAAIIRGSVRLIWGPDAQHMAPVFSTTPRQLGPVLITAQEVWVVLATLVIIVALYLFFRFTPLGKAMRATSQNRRAAQLMGINIDRIFAVAWIGGTVLSALGGVFLAPIIVVDPDMGIVGIKSFTAVVLGGFGSFPGAVLGGVLLGITENLVAGFLGAEYQLGVTFLLMLVVLAIRPTGILGRPGGRRV